MNLPLIVIDARAVSPVGHGFGRYITAMAEALAAPDFLRQFRFLFLVTAGVELPVAFRAHQTLACAAPFLSPREWIEIPRILRAQGASLYHSPTFSSLPVALMPCPWVVTVHDLNHRTYGGWKERLYYSLLLRAFCEKARAVASVSAAAAAELAQWLDTDSIEVVPNVVKARVPTPVGEARAILERFQLEERGYFLCLSGSKPHKNLGAVVGAAALIGDHCSGRRGSTVPKLKIVTTVARSELDQVAKSVGAQTAVQHSHVVSVQGVGDRELGVLYAHARATLAPSRYEGCGLVPLESLIAGTPVIVSDIPAHREGIGQTVEESEGVHWVSSPDIGVWASAMIESCRIQQSEAGIIPSSREVSESLRRSIVERHSIEKMREGLHRLYSHAFSHA